MENDSLLDGAKKSASHWVLWLIALVALVVVATSVASLAVVTVQVGKINTGSDSKDDLLACRADDFDLEYEPFRPVGPNVPDSGPIAIINATVWPVTGQAAYYPGCVLMQHGLLQFVGPCSQAPDLTPYTIYNVQGKYVTPGIVDMHSHMAVSAIPDDAAANSDNNEMTNPIFPQVKAVDGFDPEDPAIPKIRSGGVTTSLVLPGSGNIMGGEAVYVKLWGNTVAEMLIPNVPRALKMACGENPKRVYGDQGKTPMTRMGSAWLMRQIFFQGAVMKQAQEQWDCLSDQGLTQSPRPVDASLEPIVALLNEEVNLNVHCYRVEDLEMMVRLANEFGFKIAAFHHALETWKVPKLLRDNNITSATFADHWGFKMEGYEASIYGPKILDEAGVSVTLKSDHPVLFAKYLLKQAAVSHAYGLAEESSIRAVTLNAARSIGLGDRIGSLENGKEADVVVWDRYPLAAGVHADKIFINGQLTDDFQLPPVVVTSQPQVHLPTCVQGPTNIPQLALTGVTVYTFDANNTIISNAVILVQNGIITCLSPTCVVGPGFQTYNLQGGIVTPGVIATLSNLLGTREIDQEPASGDGSVSTSDASTIRAFDAIRFRSYKNKKLFAAWAGGVTSIIAPPTSSSLIAGVGTSFNPLGRFMGDVIFDNLTNIVNSDTFLHVNFGNSIKRSADAFTGSISGQIAALKRLFANNANIPPYSSVIEGQLPLVVAVNQADEIAAVIRFKQLYSNIRLIIVGGAEAWTIADLLAAQTPPVAVVLDDFTSIVEGGTFETWNSVSNSAAVLRAAGVPVVLTTLDGSNARHIRWHAASALGEGLSYQDALSSISRTPATLFFGASTTEGTVQVGNAANFVAYSGDPLSFQSTVELVVIKGSVGCKPKQY